MSSEDINKALGEFWASIIEKIDVNLCMLQVSIELSVFQTEDVSEKHEIVLDGVSAFFFVNGEGERRFGTQPWESAELSEAYFFATPRDHITHRSDKFGVSNFNADPNFYFEIWGSAFLIEAKAIEIDGRRYVAS